MNIIKVNERFSIARDPRCWHLNDHYVGVDKDGKTKIHKRVSYHANLGQVSRAVIDRSAGECKSLAEIIVLLKDADNIVTRRLVGLTSRMKQPQKLPDEAS